MELADSPGFARLNGAPTADSRRFGARTCPNRATLFQIVVAGLTLSLLVTTAAPAARRSPVKVRTEIS